MFFSLCKHIPHALTVNINAFMFANLVGSNSEKKRINRISEFYESGQKTKQKTKQKQNLAPLLFLSLKNENIQDTGKDEFLCCFFKCTV